MVNIFQQDQWFFYVIPDVKSWTFEGGCRTSEEFFLTFAEAKERFDTLRNLPYNCEPNDIQPDGNYYTRLCLGISRRKEICSIEILQIRNNQNYLTDKFTQLPIGCNDETVLDIISHVAEEFGFDHVARYTIQQGCFVNVSTIPYSEWKNPYFPVPATYDIETSITAKITNREIENIMNVAVNDGISAWCAEVGPLGNLLGQTIFQQISKGGALIFYSNWNDDTWELDINKFLNGLQLFLQDGNNHNYVKDNHISDDIDAYCADAVIQLALFNEVRY